MKKTIFLLLFSLSLFAQAPTSFQYGVRTPTLFPWNGQNKIDVNGRLKLNTTAGGFIPAAMTTTQRLAVASPQTGESVYDVTLGKYYHWDGSGWVVSGGSGGNLAATLALDNKTNSIPFSSNDESSQILLDDSSNVSITSGASSQRQLLLAEDSFYFNSNVRYVFDGKGIDMNTVSDGFGLPRLTTTAMNAIVAPTEGMLVRNTTESSIYQYDGATWEPLASAAQTLDQTTTEGNTTANDIIVTDSNGTTLTSKGYSQYVETSSGKQLFVTPNLLSYKRGSFYYNISPPATLSATKSIAWPDKSGTVAFLDDVSAPSLPEEQIAVGQAGDAFGSSSNLTFHSNRYLKVIAPSSTTSGITVGDGYLSTDNAGLYSLSADETIADYNPTSTVYNYSNGNYNYNDTTSTHNFVGAVKVGGVDALTTSTGQALDSDLTDISSLAPPNDNILQRKAGVWTSRTPAQLKTDLALVKGDLGLGNVDNTTDLNKPISTATQSALDGKVTDAIVNGVTTVAPSQNAVFDALALKQNNFILGKKGNASSSLTGTTSEAILESIFIPAGSVAVDDVIYMRNRVFKTGTLGGFTVRYRINSSNSISGSSILGVATLASAAVRAQGIERTLNFRTSNIVEVIDNTTSIAYENSTQTVANANITLTFTSDFWILITAQLTNAADSIVNSNYIIQKF